MVRLGTLEQCLGLTVIDKPVRGERVCGKRSKLAVSLSPG